MSPRCGCWSSITCCCPTPPIRRDLTDPATIRRVRDAVGDTATLRLLHALTEADSLATGPSAWGSWKEQLVAELVERVAAAIDGRDADATVSDRASFPDATTWTAMAGGRVDVMVGETGVDATTTVTVVCTGSSRVRSPASPARCRCATSTC